MASSDQYPTEKDVSSDELIKKAHDSQIRKAFDNMEECMNNIPEGSGIISNFLGGFICGWKYQWKVLQIKQKYKSE